MRVLLKPDKKAPQVFGRKTHHIRQFEKVSGMRRIITIIMADYCLMSQILLNILSNVTLPPYPSCFVHFKHTFFIHLPKFPVSSNCHATPKGHGLPPFPQILNVHLSES